MRKTVENTRRKPKTLQVDREKFEGIVHRLLDSPPLKREKIKTAKKKPEKLFPPEK
jgi:hypothetical protein